MPDAIQVQLSAIEPAEIVPGRFGEPGLRELIVALGGQDDDERDVWELLKETFDRHEVQQLGEQLLDAVLLDPPIPAYCETMLRRMMDPLDAPWIDHEITADRFNLWYCHYLVHRVYPDRWPAPPIRRAVVDVIVHDADLRPPGRRSPPGDRTAFIARLLRARPGANPIAAAYSGQTTDATEWCFDVVWAAEVGAWTRLTAESAEAAGLTIAPGTSPIRFQGEAWIAPQWLGDAAAGDAWGAGVS